MLLDGRRVVRPPREVALVFQDYSRSLFPWLTVIRNVMFPLHGVGLRKLSELRARRGGARRDGARRRLAQVSLGALGRNAAAGRDRACARLAPEILLLDEPFASVDALTRAELQDVLLRVHGDAEGRRVTIVHVTHDIDEAVYLADRVLVLSRAPGRVVGSIEVGLPRPRSQRATRSSPAFLARRNEIHALIGSQQVLQ